jgi:formate--tetrahydrofolate ligase
LKTRIGEIVLGFDFKNKPLKIKDLGIQGAITVLLKDAINPNLVQTTEHTPAIVHGGPFANIAHGCNSLIATKMALTFADYVVTEAGFGADLGAEKFFNIKCRKGNLQPKLTVIVATSQGLKMHGGVPLDSIKLPNIEGLIKGFENLDKHLENLKRFEQNIVVAFNKYDFDTADEIRIVEEHCRKIGIGFAINNAYSEGGEGAVELAKLVAETIDREPSKPLKFTYSESDDLKTKIEKIALNIYGSKAVQFSDRAEKILKYATAMGIEHYPVCIAKTQYSFSADPKEYGVPHDFKLKISDVVINNGAEFIIAIAGEIMRMPGLPKLPNAVNIDIVDGIIEGLS